MWEIVMKSNNKKLKFFLHKIKLNSIHVCFRVIFGFLDIKISSYVFDILSTFTSAQ